MMSDETQDMARRASRQIRSKTARMMLSLRLLSQGDQFGDVEYTLYRGRHARHKHPRGSAPAA